MTITGWVLTGLVVAALLTSASLKFSVPLQLGDHEKLKGMFEKQGFDVNTMTVIGVVELTCALIYLFPRTAILGAILIAGYLGGAIVVHVIGKQPIYAPLIVALLAWLGIFLREPRLRGILFWR
jgi:hypothetical protein